MNRHVLITFDLEEFDLPLEFGCHIPDDDQINTSGYGLKQVSGLLAEYNIPATFFTTSYFALKNQEVIRDLSVNHEIASHSRYHSRFLENDLADSKTDLEKITGKQIYGFRMPLFKNVDLSKINKAGYHYDSSINPTCVPGRYCNLFTQRKFYRDSGTNLIEIPLSVSPLIRFPLFWLSFKNIPLPVYLTLCRQALRKDSYLHLCFHPWEFADLEPFNIPGYIKKVSGKQLSERFEKLILELKKTCNFSTISEFLDIKGIV